MAIIHIQYNTAIRVSYYTGFDKIPKHWTSIREIVMKYRGIIRQEMTQKLKLIRKSGAKFSLTTDEWTSVRNRRYININLHKSGGTCWNLELVRSSGSLPAETILENLKRKLAEFQLDLSLDLAAITTVGAKVMEKLGRPITAEQQLQSSTWHSIICFGHVLQEIKRERDRR